MENPQSNQKIQSRNGENKDFLSCWSRVLSGQPERTALFSAAGHPLRTFAELDQEAHAWAERLARACPGHVVALQTGNLPEWPALVLATWLAGKILLPLDLDLAPARRDEVEHLCGAGCRIENSPTGLKLAALSHPAVAWPLPIPVLLKLTSGTSAAPRVVRFTAPQLIADCDAICATMGLRSDDRNYGVISFAHSYGFSNLITPLLCRGIALVVSGDMIPQAVRSGLAASAATVFPGVPALFRALSGLDAVPLALRLCLSAGSPLSPDVAQAFHQKWGRKVHPFYGSSECGGICYDATEHLISEPGFVGLPMQGAHLRSLSANWPSQVEITGAAVGEGYHPTSPEDELRAGTFRPADLLACRPEGYFITGRTSDLINVSGRKVNPSEIETALLRCPGVREAIVVGLPEGFRGEEVAACIVGSATEEDLRRYCGATLPAWQIPRRWLFLEALPVNARGKISRPGIRALF